MTKKKCVLLLLLILIALCTCSKDKGAGNAASVGVSERETIIDGAGRQVVIPENPKEATAASVYAVSVPFFSALGITDRVIAVNPKSSFWKIADKNINEAGNIGRGIVDMEKLASYSPTVLVHRSNDPKTLEAVEKLDIDVICITVEDIDDIKYTLQILGKYFGAQDRAEKSIEWIEKKLSKIQDIVKTIPKEERKTAILFGGQLGKIAGNDMLQSWMIEQAGGICVADTGQNHNWINVGIERILEYNPDVIFCTSSTARDYTEDELYTNPLWSAVNAVKTKDIYVVPTKYDSWDMPGMSCVLGTMYMLRKMYPNYLPKDVFEDEVDDYYRFMFGRCFDEELEIDWSNL